MIKEIRYTGYTTTPSDYECPDGDLETAIGVVAEDGGLQVVLAPKLLFTLPAGQKVCFVHTTSAFTHYIAYDSTDGFIYWYDEDGKIHDVYKESQLNPTYFNAIGNTLIAFADGDIHYLFWKDEAYKYLGDKLPDVDVRVSLVGHPRLFSMSDESEDTFKVSMKGDDKRVLNTEWSDETKTAVTDVVMAKLNKFIAQEATNKGRFCFPFFVRYALRLFDGSLTCHSAPILMMPGSPIVTTTGISEQDSDNLATDDTTRKYGEKCDIMLVACDVRAQFMEMGYLKDWGDIVTGIDFFVSKPIYTYDQNGQCDMFTRNDLTKYHDSFVGIAYREGCVKEPKEDNTTYLNHYADNYDLSPAEFDYWTLAQMYFNCETISSKLRVHLPEYTEDYMKDQYLSTANFYLLKSIKLEDVDSWDSVLDLDVADDYLQSLVARESMTDDYLSHDRLSAKYSFAYNNRLNLSGVTRYPYKGQAPYSLFCGCKYRAILAYQIDDATAGTYSLYLKYECTEDESEFGYTTNWSRRSNLAGDTTIDVYLNDNSTPVHVTNSCVASELTRFFYKKKELPTGTMEGVGAMRSVDCPNFTGAFLFYPNVNATRMVITNSNLGSYEIKLQQHDYLNGAVAYIPATEKRSPVQLSESTTEYKTSVDIPNKIYTSEVNDPFFFPVTNINTIGTGRILGLCTAAKALSQGQFGAYPLYAFATDGVWALEVSSSTGAFSAKQPITMDVCIASESITQIDNEVLFATDRGIMLISGSNSTCISDTLNLSQSTKLINVIDEKILNFTGIDNVEVVPFITFLRGCRMVYDYVHQHIIVFNPEYTYGYIYSKKSKKWGLINCNIASTINSYPNALCMDTDGNLVDYSVSGTTEDGETVDFALVTRPLKLDGDQLKTIDTIIQRGYFQSGNIQSILLGSRDLYNWFTVMSSKDHYLRGKFGTPYKYYKILLKGSLTSNESVAGCTIQYTPRLTNRPR